MILWCPQKPYSTDGMLQILPHHNHHVSTYRYSTIKSISTTCNCVCIVYVCVCVCMYALIKLFFKGSGSWVFPQRTASDSYSTSSSHWLTADYQRFLQRAYQSVCVRSHHSCLLPLSQPPVYFWRGSEKFILCCRWWLLWSIIRNAGEELSRSPKQRLIFSLFISC